MAFEMLILGLLSLGIVISVVVSLQWTTYSESYSQVRVARGVVANSLVVEPGVHMALSKLYTLFA